MLIGSIQLLFLNVFLPSYERESVEGRMSRGWGIGRREENGERETRKFLGKLVLQHLRRVSCVDCCAGGASPYLPSPQHTTTKQWQASSLTQSTKLWCSNQLISLIALSSKGIHTRPAIHAYLTSPHITSHHLTSLLRPAEYKLELLN